MPTLAIFRSGQKRLSAVGAAQQRTSGGLALLDDCIHEKQNAQPRGRALCIFERLQRYSAGRMALRAPRALPISSSTQRLWCSLAQLRSTVPSLIASKAPSMPIVPI
jgi:hypothetical protein